jgi:hypothetical protein
VTFTLLRQPGVSADAFERDAQAVERDLDLQTLNKLLDEP